MPINFASTHLMRRVKAILDPDQVLKTPNFHRPTLLLCIRVVNGHFLSSRRTVPHLLTRYMHDQDIPLSPPLNGPPVL